MALNLHFARRVVAACCLALCICLPVAAQQAEKQDGYRILDRIDPPKGESAEEFVTVTEQDELRQDTVYATKIDGKLFSGQEIKPPVANDAPPEFREPLLNIRGAGVVVALLIIGGGLAAWIKFGGGGALLARAPRDQRSQPVAAPDGWNMSDADAASSPTDLLSRLANMQDRAAALVLLLRYSLLSAGTATQVHFARSDTERRAFARIPRGYIHGPELAGILRMAELAHYGGRIVEDDEFFGAIEAGRSILDNKQGGAVSG